MKIVLTGGGTLGSVSPLLAVVPELKARGHELYFIGTQSGPEETVVEKAGVEFFHITAPKLRRYFSLRHVLMPFEMIIGVLQSFLLLMQWQPKVIVSAGSFVSVPVVLAGSFMGIPCVIHQQDLQQGLAIRIMRKYARKITVVFEETTKYFPKSRVEWIGNPVRDLTPTTNTIAVDASVPTVMIFGGGTGAAAINDLVSDRLCAFANVIHVTGVGKSVSAVKHARYYAFEFLNEEMKEALAKADVVVARAGLGTISELAVLGKPAIIIPMPKSHQELNADLLKRNSAAVVLAQKELTPESFAQSVEALIGDKQKQAALSKAISALVKPNAHQKFVEILESVVR